MPVESKDTGLLRYQVRVKASLQKNKEIRAKKDRSRDAFRERNFERSERERTRGEKASFVIGLIAKEKVESDAGSFNNSVAEQERSSQE